MRSGDAEQDRRVLASPCAGRREVLRILALGACGPAAWAFGVRPRGAAPAVSVTRPLLGTWVQLTVLGEDREAAQAAADGALTRMANLERVLSRHRSDSELSRLNAAGRLENASDELLDVLRLAEHVSALADGAFDVSIAPVLELYREHVKRTGEPPRPARIEALLDRVDHRAIGTELRTVTLGRSGMRLTLDGIGKGYVVDRGVDELRARGFENVLLDAGGDLVASGERAAGARWRIGVRHPRPGSRLVARFEAGGVAAATSGDYMQPFTADRAQHHILDPRTGRSDPQLASCTVLAPDAATADALATAVMVLGPRRGRALLEDLPGCEGYFLSKRLEVTRTTGFVTT